MAACRTTSSGSHRLVSETDLILPACARSLVAAAICAIALVIASIFVVPARAQAPDSDTSGAQSETGEPQASLEYFRERLTPYGAWLDHPTWGDVWRPDVGEDFRPYFD